MPELTFTHAVLHLFFVLFTTFVSAFASVYIGLATFGAVLALLVRAVSFLQGKDYRRLDFQGKEKFRDLVFMPLHVLIPAGSVGIILTIVCLELLGFVIFTVVL